MDLHVTTPVNASPEDVWRLFADVERWPEMTKSIREVRRLDSGPLRVGSEAIVKQPRLPRARWRVTELRPGRSFTWVTSAGGMTTAGDHVVEADGEGSVITLGLREHGALVPLMNVFVGGLSRRYLSMEMEGFRQTAEAARA
ncbi:MAG: SRPBCC family protein [Trebonia sp.]